ncbi:MAG: pyruvate ferredoxin oxidoreductase subunit gamma [Candidatus Woesearchaeota archaeon]
MHKIRIHGRGGQGAVTTGQILAMAAFYDKKESQTFPMFGVERAGAPVQSYVRISDKKINTRSQIYHPDIVLVLDSSLVDVVDVTEGMSQDGFIIINSNKKPNLRIKNIKTIDATSIALDIFKRPIVNTPILGAFAKATGIVSLNSLKKAIHEKFAQTKGEHISELNKKAVEKVYHMTK